MKESTKILRLTKTLEQWQNKLVRPNLKILERYQIVFERPLRNIKQECYTKILVEHGIPSRTPIIEKASCSDPECTGKF